MKDAKVRYQPSVYVSRNDGESVQAFIDRILADPRLLQDQRTSLEQDRGPSAFDDCVRGVWIERPPLPVSTSSEQS